MATDGWIPKDEDGKLIGITPWHFYIKQMYFMTTTMTTIGYGDFSAKQYHSDDYKAGDNMLLIFFLQFFAILTFSLI